MPDHATARKPRRFPIVALFVLVLLIAAGWCGFWFYGRGQVETRMDAWVAQLKTQGATVSWKTRTIEGFPFRYQVTLTEFVAGETGGWTVAAPSLVLVAHAYNPFHVVATAGPAVSFYRATPADGFSVTGDILRMSISHFRSTPPKLAFEGVNLKFPPAGKPTNFTAMERFELRIAPTEKGPADLFLRLHKATPAVDALLSRISAGKPVTIGLEGQMTYPAGLKSSGGTGAVRNWALGGGQLNIRQGGLDAGAAQVSLRPSTLTADPGGTLRGDLNLSLANASQAVLALGAVGVLPEPTAAVASGLAPSGGTSARPVNATLTFRDGLTLFGPLPLGPAPRVP